MMIGPYRVEQADMPCEKCGAGGTWAVVGGPTDDTEQSVPYGDKHKAEWLADALNAAFGVGMEALR